MDLDRGGAFLAWGRQFLGPSVGWTYVPGDNVLPITAAGTYPIDVAINLITVNVAGVVIIVLPSAIDPLVPAIALPGLFVNNPITIIDVGGHAGGNAITIQPFAGQNIAGLSSLTISANYGGYILTPNSSTSGWSHIP